MTVIHIEKPGQEGADTIFFLCGQFCTLAGDCGIHRRGIDFVSLPGPWPEPPTCERCTAAATTPAVRREEAVA